MLATGDPETASEVLFRASVLDPQNPKLRTALGDALYQSGDFDSALAWLQPLAHKGHARLDLLRGLIHHDSRQFPQALSAFEAALQADPSLDEARLQRAAVFIAEANHGAALADLDEVLRQTANHPKALELRATAWLEAGQPREALLDLGRIPGEHGSPEHVLLEARARILAGRPAAEVESTFTLGMERYPTDGRLRLSLGRYLASRRGSEPHAAVRAAEAVRGLAEDGPASLKLQAEALFLLGELASEEPDGLDRAESYYHRGLALQPDDPEGLTGMGSLMLRQGRPAHALPWLLQSAMLDPERPQTVENLARALAAVTDDEAVARWIGLISAGLPRQSPTLLAHLLRFVQEAGRSDAYEEVRREGHRMKNRVAVLASRPGSGDDARLREQLTQLYQDWAAFLDRIRQPSPLPTLVSPARVVRRAVQQAIGDPGRIRTTIPAGLPLLKGEEEGLTDALANVLRNAVEASASRGVVRLAVRFKRGSRWVDIAVTDEGPGIAMEDRRRIFDPGFSKREGGSGLGLSIAQRVVMAHGGRILVASAPGGPTTFTLRLPVAIVPAQEHLQAYQAIRFQQRTSSWEHPRDEGEPGETEHAG